MNNKIENGGIESEDVEEKKNRKQKRCNKQSRR